MHETFFARCIYTMKFRAALNSPDQDNVGYHPQKFMMSQWIERDRPRHRCLEHILLKDKTDWRQVRSTHQSSQYVSHTHCIHYNRFVSTKYVDQINSE